MEVFDEDLDAVAGAFRETGQHEGLMGVARLAQDVDATMELRFGLRLAGQTLKGDRRDLPSRYTKRNAPTIRLAIVWR